VNELSKRPYYVNLSISIPKKKLGLRFTQYQHVSASANQVISYFRPFNQITF